MIATRIDQLKAAPAAASVLSPAPACPVGDLVHDDIDGVGHHLTQTIGANLLVWHGKRHTFAGMGKVPAIFAQSVVGREISIVCEQVGQVLCYH